MKIALSEHLAQMLPALPRNERKRILRAINRVRTKRFSSGVRVKKLHSRPQVAVWEARFSDYGRLLFTYGQHPHRATREPVTVAHFWTAVFDHDNVPRELRRRPFETPEIMQWILADEVSAFKWNGQTFPDNPAADLEAIEEHFPDTDGTNDYWEAYAALSSEYPAAWTTPPENLPWYLEGPIAFEMWAEAQNIPAELILTEEQIDLLQMPLPVFLNGPAGSGKTTLALYRLLVLQENNPEARTAFITHNPRLVAHAEELYHTLPTCPKDATPVDFLTYQDLVARVLELSSVERDRQRAPKEVLHDLLHHRPLTHADRQLFATEIRSVIKGMIPRTDAVLPTTAINWVLTRAAYDELPEKWSAVPPDKRADAYQLATQYQRLLRDQEWHDTQDMATRALHALPLHDDTSAAYDAVFLDEVQDLTEKQLHVTFAMLRRDRKTQLLLTGDPTQVLNGSGFGWRMPKAMFFRRDWEVPSPHTLRRSFRAGAATLRLPNAVANLLRAEKATVVPLDPDKARRDGPTPQRISPDASVDDVLSQGRPNVLVLVADDETAASLREAWGHPFVWSVAEAKGLEADHVVLYKLPDHLEHPSDLATKARQAADRRWNQHILRLHYVAATRARRSVTIVANPHPDDSLWHAPGVANAVDVKEIFDPVWSHQASERHWLKRAVYYRDHEQWTQAAVCYRNANDDAWELLCAWIADPSQPPLWAEVYPRIGACTETQAQVLLECSTPIRDLPAKVHLLRTLNRETEADAVQARHDEATGNWEAAARYHYDQNNHAKAGTLYKKMEAWLPAATCFKRAERWLDAARCFRQNGAWEQAADHYEKAQQWSEAAVCCTKLDAWDRAGPLFQKSGKWEEAAHCYRRTESWSKAADCHSSAQKWKEAAHDYRRAEKWRLAGLHFKKARQWRAAGHSYRNAKAWEDAGMCYRRNGDGKRAGDCYAKIHQWNTAGACYREAEAWKNAALCYSQAKSWEAAVECFEHAGMPQWTQACTVVTANDTDKAFRALWETHGALSTNIAAFLLEHDVFLKDPTWQIWLLHQAGRDEKASALRQLYDAGHHTWAAIADTYVAQTQYKQAAIYYERAEEWSAAAQCFREVSDWSRAKRCYHNAEEWSHAAACARLLGHAVWQHLYQARANPDNAESILRDMYDSGVSLSDEQVAFLKNAGFDVSPALLYAVTSY
ncbi:MAG: AAA family ATPase [Spiribacter salinus]|uniref:AAA family ATPase n=2 Tax=Pseudomonadati TaxID=3379134 RepID=A0A540VN50_9GAMM|nr:MAG: AAA family ATPase [Spiribacter salinus]